MTKTSLGIYLTREIPLSFQNIFFFNREPYYIYIIYVVIEIFKYHQLDWADLYPVDDT